MSRTCDILKFHRERQAQGRKGRKEGSKVRHINARSVGVALLVAAVCIRVAAQEDLSAKQVFEASKDSIVKVETDKVIGSGFFIKNGGLVATCYHVIENAAKIVVTDADKSIMEVEAVYFDKEADAAILKLSAKSSRRPLPIGTYSAVSTGDDVFVIGSPLGVLDQSLTSGIVSAKRKVAGIELIQFTAAISAGSSGSPVINSKGQVIGFVSFSFAAGESLNMAVSSTFLASLLTEEPVPLEIFVQTAKRASEEVTPPSPREPAKSKSDAALKVRASESFADFFGEIGDVFLRWLIWWQKDGHRQEISPSTVTNRSFGYYDELTNVLLRSDPFLTEISGSPLWDADQIEAFFESTKALRVIALEHAETESYASVEAHWGTKKSRDAANQRMQESTRRLNAAYSAFYDRFGDRDWFDWNSFRRRLSPPVFAFLFGTLGDGVLPDPLFKRECYVGYAPSTSQLRTGDRITGVGRLGSTMYTTINNWRDLDRFFERNRRDHGDLYINVRYLRRGSSGVASVEIRKHINLRVLHRQTGQCSIVCEPIVTSSLGSGPPLLRWFPMMTPHRR